MKKLNPEQDKILNQCGTEPPFTGKLLKEKRTGDYLCAKCENKLFDSDTKFDSGTGWPSFDNAIPNAIKKKKDSSMGIERTEVVCNKCGGHLGHLFNDGPTSTGKRYCINSLALDFKEKK